MNSFFKKKTFKEILLITFPYFSASNYFINLFGTTDISLVVVGKASVIT